MRNEVQVLLEMEYDHLSEAGELLNQIVHAIVSTQELRRRSWSFLHVVGDYLVL